MIYTFITCKNSNFNRKREKRVNSNAIQPENNVTNFSDLYFKSLGSYAVLLILFVAFYIGSFPQSIATAQSQINIEWNQSSQAVITKSFRSNNEYEDRVATVSIVELGATSNFGFIVEESKNSSSPSRLESPAQKEVISTEKFPGMETTFEQGLTYGNWYISSFHSDSNQIFLLFRPNANAINQLVSHDQVTSELTIVLNETINGEIVERARDSISVEIRGPRFDIQSYLNSEEAGGNNIASIFPIESQIIEGEDVEFQVIMSNAVDEELQIALNISQIGNYIEGSLPDSLDISTGESSAVLSLPTSENSIYDTPGTITAELVAGSGYNVTTSSYNSASVRVVDDDGNFGISVIASETKILEGETAQFQIVSDQVAIEDLEIFYNLIKRGDFLSETISNSIEIARLKKSAVLNIATQDDGIVNTSGSFTITILENEAYQVARVPFNNAEVAILDKDIPVLSIFSIGTGAVTEGENIQFKVTSSTAFSRNTLVNVNIQFAQESDISRNTQLLIMAGETEGYINYRN